MMKRSFGQVVLLTLAMFCLSACSGGGSSSGSPPPPTRGSAPPTITLSGEAQSVVQQFAAFQDQGATVTDDVDRNLTVTVSGNVNTNIIGRYTLRYSATDSNGNTTIAERIVDVVGETLFPFYSESADRFTLPDSYVRSVDTFIYGSDEINDDNFPAAQRLVDDIFAAQPVASAIWRNGVGSQGLNVGDPVAYYGLRMLDEITQSSTPLPTTDTLRMTVVIAPCADVVRPTNPNDLTQDEYVRLNIDPGIMENDFAILYRATEVFRQWVKSIANGSEIVIQPYVLEDCSFVSYFVSTFDTGASAIFSLPDTFSMLLGVPDEITQQTDMWWVITPSGVPGDGSGYPAEFVTGGMGTDDFGNALFISDDLWLLRKPSHLGRGPYSEVEQRTYLPQWFQHEYMHHIYREWPEFGLEQTGHQWFDRRAWPSDFEGTYEADYYAESISKRLRYATPSLAEGLKRKTAATE